VSGQAAASGVHRMRGALPQEGSHYLPGSVQPQNSDRPLVAPERDQSEASAGIGIRKNGLPTEREIANPTGLPAGSSDRCHTDILIPCTTHVD
jgi:hypothetical protein